MRTSLLANHQPMTELDWRLVAALWGQQTRQTNFRRIGTQQACPNAPFVGLQNGCGTVNNALTQCHIFVCVCVCVGVLLIHTHLGFRRKNVKIFLVKKMMYMFYSQSARIRERPIGFVRYFIILKTMSLTATSICDCTNKIYMCIPRLSMSSESFNYSCQTTPDISSASIVTVIDRDISTIT